MTTFGGRARNRRQLRESSGYANPPSAQSYGEQPESAGRKPISTFAFPRAAQSKRFAVPAACGNTSNFDEHHERMQWV
jgi:hypothetical protein